MIYGAGKKNNIWNIIINIEIYKCYFKSERVKVD